MSRSFNSTVVCKSLNTELFFSTNVRVCNCLEVGIVIILCKAFVDKPNLDVLWLQDGTNVLPLKSGCILLLVKTL
jgi:hypothetical protein